MSRAEAVEEAAHAIKQLWVRVTVQEAAVLAEMQVAVLIALGLLKVDD